MKIDGDELRRLYRSAADAGKPGSRRTCPSPDQIIELLEGTLSARERIRLADHLAGCALCCEEYLFLRDLRLPTDELVAELETWARGRGSAQGRAPERPPRGDGAVPVIRPEKKRRDPRPWRFVFGTAATALTVALLIVFVPRLKKLWQGESRMSPARGIELISPRNGARISRQAAFFRWKPIARAEHYVLEIFDEALAPVWKSPEIRTNVYSFTHGLPRELSPLKAYYWVVTGFLPDESRVESGVGSFVLKN